MDLGDRENTASDSQAGTDLELSPKHVHTPNNDLLQLFDNEKFILAYDDLTENILDFSDSIE